MNRILIVDDEKNVLSSFKKILTQDGYEIFTANNAEEGLHKIENNPINLLIMDIKMPGMNGLEAFSRFKEKDAKMPIILMTAYGTMDTAVKAMQLGAYDYIIKPFEVPQIKKIIRDAVEAARLMKTEVAYEPNIEFKGDRIIGISSKMQQIYKTIGQVASSDVTVLLRGESGVGKELIARAIYHHSNRKNKPFLVINSAAIPETLLESELFGYERGAFTDARERRIGKLEQCDGGTIFLDEIGDMPSSIQTKILRIIEGKSFERLGSSSTIKADIRLIAATNRDLEELIKEDKFRKDLYYRLNVVNIDIPPLRERREDIPQLTDYFLNKYSRELNKDLYKISDEALKILQEYSWPGNVRELENVIKKAVLFSKGNVISPEYIFITDKVVSINKDTSAQLRDLLCQFVKEGFEAKTSSLYKEVIEEIEKNLIIEALKQTQGNQSQAASFLGISRPTLKDKIEKLGLVKIVSLQQD